MRRHPEVTKFPYFTVVIEMIYLRDLYLGHFLVSCYSVPVVLKHTEP